MKVEYDKEAEAIYVKLMDIPNGGVDHTEELVPDTIMVDRTKLGAICGIEILGVDKIEDITEACNEDWEELSRNPEFISAMAKIIEGLEKSSIDWDKVKKVSLEELNTKYSSKNTR